MEKYEKEAETLLRRLGTNGSYVGFRYVLYGVNQVHQNPHLTTCVCKGLYPEIAAHFHTSISCTERNIRTLINTIWEHGNRNLLNEIFYQELTEKPVNAAFIDAIAQYTENLRYGTEGQERG